MRALRKRNTANLPIRFSWSRPRESTRRCLRQRSSATGSHSSADHRNGKERYPSLRDQSSGMEVHMQFCMTCRLHCSCESLTAASRRFSPATTRPDRISQDRSGVVTSERHRSCPRRRTPRISNRPSKSPTKARVRLVAARRLTTDCFSS